MADIKISRSAVFSQKSAAKSPESLPSAPADGATDPLIEIIELLFFAYRDFTSDPDAILEAYDFGRAHHRVIHFVGRHPGITVAELLAILGITKQSLARVLKQLVEEAYVIQKTGTKDRRQRLLYLSDKGEELERRLSQPQRRRVAAALAEAERQLGLQNDTTAQTVRDTLRASLLALVNEEHRHTVAKLIEEGQFL